MTLAELSRCYEEAAVPLRNRLRELRIALSAARDPEEIWHLKRRIAELTLRYGAASVVLAHNHPGATVCPSPEDEQATCLLDEALRSVGVVLLEHYVIARGKYTPIRLWSQNLRTVRPPAFYGETLMARVAGLCFQGGQ